MTAHPLKPAAGPPRLAALPGAPPEALGIPVPSLLHDQSPSGGTGPKPRAWTVVFPPGMEILTGNNRLSRYPKARVVKALREQGWAQAKRLGLPRLERAEIHVTYLPPPRRLQDRHPLASARIEDGQNLDPTSKALIDGIVSAGVLRSDSRKYVRRVSNELLEGTCPRGQVVLHITEVTT